MKQITSHLISSKSFWSSSEILLIPSRCLKAIHAASSLHLQRHTKSLSLHHHSRCILVAASLSSQGDERERTSATERETHQDRETRERPSRAPSRTVSVDLPVSPDLAIDVSCFHFTVCVLNYWVCFHFTASIEGGGFCSWIKMLNSMDLQVCVLNYWVCCWDTQVLMMHTSCSMKCFNQKPSQNGFYSLCSNFYFESFWFILIQNVKTLILIHFDSKCKNCNFLCICNHKISAASSAK